MPKLKPRKKKEQQKTKLVEFLPVDKTKEIRELTFKQVKKLGKKKK